jgi:hypothetical protein
MFVTTPVSGSVTGVRLQSVTPNLVEESPTTIAPVPGSTWEGSDCADAVDTGTPDDDEAVDPAGASVTAVLAPLDPPLLHALSASTTRSGRAVQRRRFMLHPSAYHAKA